MNYKRVIIDIITIIVLFIFVCSIWFVGYNMGWDDRNKRIRYEIKEDKLILPLQERPLPKIPSRKSRFA